MGDYLRRQWVETKDNATLRCILLAINRKAMISNMPAKFSAEAGEHHSIQAPAYARFSAPMREVVGCFTHSELAQAMGWEAPSEDNNLRDEVIRVANEAKRVQKQINKELEAAILFALFQPELEKPVAERTVWRGAILGVDPGTVKSARAYVQLLEVPLELKVYACDLSGEGEKESGYAVKKGVIFRPLKGGGENWKVGDRVGVRVMGFKKGEGKERDRWKLCLVRLQGGSSLWLEDNMVDSLPLGEAAEVPEEVKTKLMCSLCGVIKRCFTAAAERKTHPQGKGTEAI